jgi:hypothetical protein
VKAVSDVGELSKINIFGKPEKMKRIFTTTILLFVLTCAYAQDTAKKASYRHEIGFNAMRLVDMLSLIEAPADQLPYDVFYNFYFNDKIGVRAGAGILKQTTQTQILGQSKPRKTSVSNMNFRIGITNNFVRMGAITVNGFADFVWQNLQNKSVTTTTMQPFGDPVVTTTVKSDEKSTGIGGQVGLGVNLRIYKNLCIYTEVPVTFMSIDSNSHDEVSDDIGNFDSNSQSLSSSEIKITLPATIYLVLRF